MTTTKTKTTKANKVQICPGINDMRGIVQMLRHARIRVNNGTTDDQLIESAREVLALSKKIEARWMTGARDNYPVALKTDEAMTLYKILSWFATQTDDDNIALCGKYMQQLADKLGFTPDED